MTHLLPSSIYHYTEWHRSVDACMLKIRSAFKTLSLRLDGMINHVAISYVALMEPGYIKGDVIINTETPDGALRFTSFVTNLKKIKG